MCRPVCRSLTSGLPQGRAVMMWPPPAGLVLHNLPLWAPVWNVLPFATHRVAFEQKRQTVAKPTLDLCLHVVTSTTAICRSLATMYL